MIENKSLGTYDLGLNSFDKSDKLIRTPKQEPKAETVRETDLGMRTANKQESLPDVALNTTAGTDGGTTPGQPKRRTRNK